MTQNFLLFYRRMILLLSQFFFIQEKVYKSHDENIFLCLYDIFLLDVLGIINNLYMKMDIKMLYMFSFLMLLLLLN